MQELLSGSQMKAVDRYNIETLGIPSLVLMERAALAVAREAEKLSKPEDRVLFVCGMGNNGADGLAAARMRVLHGRKAEVLLVGDPARATEEHTVQRRILEKLDIPVNTMDSYPEYSIESPYGLVVDAIFGIGLSRPLAGEAEKAVSLVNRVASGGSRVLAVDIPSGISASNGQVLGIAVKADVTVTFGYEKVGMVLYPGTSYAGRRIVADIGFAPVPHMEPLARTFFPGEKGRLPRRPADGNKGTFGRVFLAAGSAGMSGAACLSAKSAYRSGAGLVEVYTVEENRPIVQTLVPEAVVTVYTPAVENGSEQEKYEGLLKRAAVLVAGPGLSTEPYAGKLLAGLLQEAKKREIPCVLDADALNLLSGNRELFRYLHKNTVVTPHMGEMARLTGKTVAELKADPIKAAADFHRETGAVCVLKDARTVVASEKGIYINCTGNDGMATGGSGDVLSGILGGLLAGLSAEERQNGAVADLAELGVYLHGLAGDKAAERYGRRSMTAADLAASVSEVLLAWE